MNACPNCQAEIDIADVNMKEGVALCRACGKLSALSLIANPPPSAAQLAVLPRGCRWTDHGDEVQLRVSARSIPAGLFLLFFAGFWNSIVSVFVTVIVSGFLSHVGMLPAWAPKFTNKGGNAPSVGMLIGMTLFMIPFVLVGVGVAGAALLALAGRVVATVRGTDVQVWTGVGPLGWTRRLDASGVRSIGLEEQRGTKTTSHLIKIETPQRVFRFASMLPYERQEWLAGMLHLLLVQRGRPRHQHTGDQFRLG